jgi:hypothetical protein
MEILPRYPGGCDVHEWQQQWLSSTRRSNVESITPFLSGGNQGNTYNLNQPSVKDLFFGQAKINEGFNNKMATYDKALESLNVKIDSVSSALKNQLSFIKMVEAQLAQLAALVPSAEDGKIPGQPVSSCENDCAVSTRWGKSSGRARAANYVWRPIQQVLDQ